MIFDEDDSVDADNNLAKAYNALSRHHKGRIKYLTMVLCGISSVTFHHRIKNPHLFSPTEKYDVAVMFDKPIIDLFPREENNNKNNDTNN